MNWVDGTDLQQVLEEQGDPGLPLSEVIDDLAQVADALDHLHAHEPPIVHGDVKPANLVRTPAGGSCSSTSTSPAPTPARVASGRSATSPPRWRPVRSPAPAADVFGLAATAVTLLNGQPPTDATPTYPGFDPAQQGQLARVLRAAPGESTPRDDRARRRRLVENLRTHGATRAARPGSSRSSPPRSPTPADCGRRSRRDARRDGPPPRRPRRGRRAARRARRHVDERG